MGNCHIYSVVVEMRERYYDTPKAENMMRIHKKSSPIDNMKLFRHHILQA